MPTSLRQLAARLRSAADPVAALQLVAPEIQAAVVADVQTRMRQGKQPDGTPQPPLKHPRPSGNTGPPLDDYGRLLGSVTAAVVRTKVRVSATGPGARRHQKERPHLGLSGEGKVTVGKLIMVGFLRRLQQAG